MAFALLAKKRTGSADETRVEGMIPGVVYGPNMEPLSLAVNYTEFDKLYNNAGESSLIDLTIEGQKEPVKVLIQDLQHDPVKGRITHFDLRQINMNKEIEAAIELSFTGVAPAEKEAGGTLVKTLEYLNVRCLPKDLVSEIIVDISTLKTFDDTIRIADIKLPSGVECTDNADTLIAKVNAPLTEDQLKAMEEENSAAVDLSKIEISEERGKKEEEAAEGAEGDKKE